MKKYAIKSFTFVMAVILLTTFMFPLNTFAEDTSSAIMPRWSIICIMELDIVFFSEEEAVVTAAVTGQSNVTLLESKITLFEYVNGAWVLMETYEKTSTYASLGMELEFDPVCGRDYKAYFYVTAHSADDRERTYCKVEETCPNP